MLLSLHCWNPLNTLSPVSSGAFFETIPRNSMMDILASHDCALWPALATTECGHGNTGDYPPEEVAQMAHSLAVKAIRTP
jgi:hypothetical protein